MYPLIILRWYMSDSVIHDAPYSGSTKRSLIGRFVSPRAKSNRFWIRYAGTRTLNVCWSTSVYEEQVSRYTLRTAMKQPTAAASESDSVPYDHVTQPRENLSGQAQRPAPTGLS